MLFAACCMLQHVVGSNGSGAPQLQPKPLHLPREAQGAAAELRTTAAWKQRARSCARVCAAEPQCAAVSSAHLSDRRGPSRSPADRTSGPAPARIGYDENGYLPTRYERTRTNNEERTVLTMLSRVCGNWGTNQIRALRVTVETESRPCRRRRCARACWGVKSDARDLSAGSSAATQESSATCPRASCTPCNRSTTPQCNRSIPASAATLPFAKEPTQIRVYT